MIASAPQSSVSFRTSFNGVIRRYDDWIRVDRLDEVVGLTDAECNEIARIHKICCDVVTAHDSPSAKNAPVPTASQLAQYLADLKAVIAVIKARRKGPVTSTTTATAATP
jgi:hypothetical protein